MSVLDDAWRNYASTIPGLIERRPDFRFDPVFYAEVAKTNATSPADLADHFRAKGRAAGTPPTRYVQMKAADPAVDDVLRDLVQEPALGQLIQDGDEEAFHLICELIGLGDPLDAAISDFSAKQYLKMYSDIAAAGVNPLFHYLCYGSKEGRRTLAYLRKSRHVGKRAFDPAKPVCLICVHEMSRTGAPIVGRDLAQEAAETYNVIVMSLRDGPLLDSFLEHASEVLVTDDPFHEFETLSSLPPETIEFAIINSAAAYPFVSFMVGNDIKFASYIHEYTEYMYPAHTFNTFPLFSDLMVFSSEHLRNSWRDRLKDINFDIDADSRIIPQRLPIYGSVSPEAQVAARKRLSKIIGRDLSECRIVCGAGQPQWRKGTDMFAMAAQICRRRDPDTIFIWIGHGVQHDELNFGAYMAHHLKEIGASQQGSNLHFIEAGPAYKDLLIASDTMFVSSRLDPLPNVVFDALEMGCRIVQFEGASGFTDEVYRASDRFSTVEFGNLDLALDEILNAPRQKPGGATPSRPQFRLFETIADSLRERLKAQRYFVAGASQIDEPVLFAPDPYYDKARTAERARMFQYDRRRLWRDLADVESELAASDNWVHRRIGLSQYGSLGNAPVPDFSLHIHAYYTDELASDLRNYPLYRHARRILVTTDSEKKAEAIHKIAGSNDLSVETVLVPNTGRDILPFLKLFEPGGAAGEDEIWCHIHQKKSVDLAVAGDKWRRFLLRILFGDGDAISNAVGLIARGDTGLVAPFDPHFIGWNESRRLFPKFADRLAGPLPDHPLLFPVGNMFWVRRPVVLAMNDLFGPDYMWPGEPIANDGTEYHLIERLWPAMAASLSLQSVFVHKLDEKRL